jgi:tryptophan-rich sensory protein
MKNFKMLLVFILTAWLVGFLSSLVTMNVASNIYTSLTLPSFAPPSWVFAPVWTILYIFMGVAAWFVWEKGRKDDITKPMTFYFAQLVVNFFWSLFFFGLGNCKLAFFTIVVLLVLIALTKIYFCRVTKIAGLLLLPYFLWVCYAGILNAAICYLNS